MKRKQIRVCVLRVGGTNCDEETKRAFDELGVQTEIMHVNEVIRRQSLLRYDVLVLPGGFSYGDYVRAGAIWAKLIVAKLGEELRKFVAENRPILGICNGFQVLVKAGILPGWDSTDKQGAVTITYNDSGKFEDRWVYLAPQTEKCIFIEPGRGIYLPVAHGEGKVVTKDEATLEKLKSEGHIAFKYVDKGGKEGDYPINPNGSVDSIAGLTDATGRVLGLMPHPERHVRPTQHPHWSRFKNKQTGDGMTIFTNAVGFVQENF